MNGYTCLKALVLGGIGYAAGSNIPAEAVLPNRVSALTRQGYISPATDEPSTVEPLDGRKTVKAVAQSRAEALGNQSGGDTLKENDAENEEGQRQGVS